MKKKRAFLAFALPPNLQTRHSSSVHDTKPVCHTCRSLTSTMPRNRKMMASDVELQSGGRKGSIFQTFSPYFGAEI